MRSVSIWTPRRCRNCIAGRPGRTVTRTSPGSCRAMDSARQQGSVYLGDRTADPVRCVLAIQDVARDCSWFSQVVRDVRMLRIEENNDLLPAIEGAL